jgi:hypothetical protein
MLEMKHGVGKRSVTNIACENGADIIHTSLESMCDAHRLRGVKGVIVNRFTIAILQNSNMHLLIVLWSHRRTLNEPTAQDG